MTAPMPLPPCARCRRPRVRNGEPMFPGAVGNGAGDLCDTCTKQPEPTGLLTLAPPPWTADALCAQTDPELFFPEKGQPNREAIAVCRACPVRAECLLYALENNERHGIWGGVPERTRRRLATQTRKEAS